MSVYTITFSPTGGTKKAADRLAAAFGPEVQEIDLTARETDYSRISFGDGDVCVVAVPSYGGRVPAAAVSRLAQMNGTGANAVLMAVYGNRAYEDTLSELKDVLVRAGFRCIAAVGAVAGIYWRKAKRKLQDKLGIDEDAKKQVEDDVIELKDEDK